MAQYLEKYPLNKKTILAWQEWLACSGDWVSRRHTCNTTLWHFKVYSFFKPRYCLNNNSNDLTLCWHLGLEEGNVAAAHAQAARRGCLELSVGTEATQGSLLHTHWQVQIWAEPYSPAGRWATPLPAWPASHLQCLHQQPQVSLLINLPSGLATHSVQHEGHASHSGKRPEFGFYILTWRLSKVGCCSHCEPSHCGILKGHWPEQFLHKRQNKCYWTPEPLFQKAVDQKLTYPLIHNIEATV